MQFMYMIIELKRSNIKVFKVHDLLIFLLSEISQFYDTLKI